MGFDNECIMSIQSLPGEYFCPVCRTLIYPSEALQTQCTHLYCKPCLSYVVATTKACPYDGYLVTETDSKPLMESNKSLAETIGKVTVHCLYHKSGCQWQGTLSASITHGTTCAYGNSPVVCNRCGTQIVHRQVQEHAQLCPGLQSQAQQSDGSQASAGTTHAVTQDSSLASAGSAAASSTTLPSASATAVTAPTAATGGPVGATTSNTAVPSSFAAASAIASQTPTAEQWYQQQQLQYSQYYQQQQHPGYNPYMQQYQQYGQYQQVYQQYTQPQMQVPSQSVAPGSAQPASYVQPQVQSSQPQYMMQSQPQNQPQLPPPTGHQQPQLHPAQSQTQSQPHLPHVQAPAGQSQPQQPQPMQSAPQIPQMQPQSQVALQLPGPQAQPAAHPPGPTQIGNPQLVIPSTQSTPLQVQQHAHANPPQHGQQSAQLQTLPPQQNLQPQMQLNSQTQHQPLQMQQQSYPQPQAYAHPTPAQSQNPSYPQQQMPQGAPLQHPAQQGLAPKHPVPMRPPMPGQQPAMLPQANQYTQQHQQHIGYNAQRPPMHSSIPSQTSQLGLPPHPSVSSQAGLSYQQGMPSSQQQMHSQPAQPYGTSYTQQSIPGHGYGMSHVAQPQQFQHQHGGPVNDAQASVMSQHPPMPRTSDNVALAAQSHGAGQSSGQGSLTVETHASKLGKSEIASNVADNTTVSENINGGAESALTKMSESLGNENMNREHNDFAGVRKDVVQTGVAVGSTDGSIAKDETAGRTAIQGGKEHKVADTSIGLEKGKSFQQASRQNAGALGSYGPPGMGPYHPSGPDRMLPQHMMYSDHMPYNMPEQPNQMRPPKHSFSENIRHPMQQPYAFGENQIQMPMPQPVGIRPGDGMIRPPMVSTLPGRHDTMVPPFVSEHLGRPDPLGMSKSNGLGGGPLGSGRAFHEEGFNASAETLRSFAAYPGGHNINHKDIGDDLKQFPWPAHLDGQGLQRGPRPFDRALGRPDGFPDSLPGRPPFPNQQEFGHHRADGMPNLRNPGPFVQGMSGGPGGLHTDQLGSGNVHNAFDGPEFPRTHFYPGHMHPDGPNLVTDYSRHGFPKETGHFGLGGLVRNGDVGWCRICMFNCGSAENLDLHVQTREHQQYAMDIVMKMKQDVAKRQKMNFGGPKSFQNKKVAGKGHFRGNRR